MKLSHNTLVIKNLSTDMEQDALGFCRVHSNLEAEIQMICPVTRNVFRRISIKSENKGMGVEEALRKVIEDFINGRVESRLYFYDVPFDCDTHKRITHIDLQVPEPYKSIFEQLFDLNSWEIPKKELQF